MILDEYLEFADATSVAAAAGTALIGDVVDLGAVTQDIGIGEDMWLVVQATTEIITGGVAGTLNIQLVSDAQAAIATDGTATVHLQTGALVTNIAASNDARFNVGGVILAVRLPAGTYERYLGILAVTATTTTTAGAINAFLTKDYAKWVATADATN